MSQNYYLWNSCSVPAFSSVTGIYTVYFFLEDPFDQAGTIAYVDDFKVRLQ